MEEKKTKPMDKMYSTTCKTTNAAPHIAQRARHFVRLGVVRSSE